MHAHAHVCVHVCACACLASSGAHFPHRSKTARCPSFQRFVPYGGTSQQQKTRNVPVMLLQNTATPESIHHNSLFLFFFGIVFWQPLPKDSSQYRQTTTECWKEQAGWPSFCNRRKPKIFCSGNRKNSIPVFFPPSRDWNRDEAEGAIFTWS